MIFTIPYVLMHLQKFNHATYCASRILVVFYQQFPKLKPAKTGLKLELKFKTENKKKKKENITEKNKGSTYLARPTEPAQ
jgi:hypothetical protein